MYNFKLIEWLILLAYEFEIIMISINIENSNLVKILAICTMKSFKL